MRLSPFELRSLWVHFYILRHSNNRTYDHGRNEDCPRKTDELGEIYLNVPHCPPQIPDGIFSSIKQSHYRPGQVLSVPGF